MKVKVTQSCPTLCDPMDYTVLGILQARILEWVAIPFSRGSSQPRDQTQVSTLQVDSSLSEPPGMTKIPGMGSLSLLQGNLLNPGIELRSPVFRWLLYHLSHQGRLIFWKQHSKYNGSQMKQPIHKNNEFRC